MSFPAGWVCLWQKLGCSPRARSRYGALLLIVNLLLAPAAILILAQPGFAWAAAPAALAAPLRLLAFGDSLTAGYGLAGDQSFPVQLEAALRARGHDIQVINGGISGDTSASGLARLDWALADNPDFVLIELGANDGLRGLDPEQTYANLDAIVTKLRLAHIPVLLTGMIAPPNLGRDYGAAFATAYTRVVKKHSVIFYPFFLDGVATRAELNQSDGIHPTARGVGLIVEHILPSVERLLASHE